MWSNTQFDRFFVGYDQLAEKISKAAELSAKAMQANYPPYNIKKVAEDRYTIEMAVAGFGKSEIDIELADGKLTVKGNTSSDDKSDNILYQGLAMRPFTRQFTLADNVEVVNANLINGILKIALEAIIPEHKKPKKINIEDEEQTTAEFLSEEKE